MRILIYLVNYYRKKGRGNTDKIKLYNHISKIYDGLYQDDESKIIDKYIKNILKIEAVQYYDILDVGCGTGFLLDILDIDTNGYLGIDISPGMIKRAKKKYPKYNFKVSDKIPKKKYAVYIFLFSLNYIGLKALSSIPRGSLVYMVNLTQERIEERKHKEVWDNTGKYIPIEMLKLYLNIKDIFELNKKYVYIKGVRL